MAVSQGVASADEPDNDLGTNPPTSSTEFATFNSPTSASTTDHGDGSFTFVQQVDEASTAPHYTGPWSSGGSYGFEFYSWHNQDYGWKHTFPGFSQSTQIITSATLTIRAWDVDSETFHGTGGEFDGVTGDGNWLNPQYLQGQNDQWSVTVFDVDPSTLLDGELDIHLDIDMTTEGS